MLSLASNLALEKAAVESVEEGLALSKQNSYEFHVSVDE